MQSLDHADLGERTATGEDERQGLHGIDLRIREIAKVGGSHDSVGRQRRIARDDADLVGNSLGSLDVVTRHHVNGDTCSTTLLDSTSGFGTRRIVETGETEELEVHFDLGAFRNVLGLCIHGLAGDAQNTKTLGGKDIGLGENGGL